LCRRSLAEPEPEVSHVMAAIANLPVAAVDQDAAVAPSVQAEARSHVGVFGSGYDRAVPVSQVLHRQGRPGLGRAVGLAQLDRNPHDAPSQLGWVGRDAHLDFHALARGHAHVPGCGLGTHAGRW
jgi:hypothetical protein